MTHRFFVAEELDKKKETTISDKHVVHQLLHVLRVQIAGPIILLDNSGYEYSGAILNITKEAVQIGIQKKEKNKNELPFEINLFQGILKHDHMEFVFEKGTELGVASFAPFLSSRVVKTGIHYERARKIIKEAAEQSGRGKLPTLNEITDFKSAAEGAGKQDLNIIFYEKAKEGPGSLKAKKHPKRVNIFIGPEGGFSDEEIALAKKNKFHVLSLGKTKLRGETAAIVATALVREL